MIRLKNIFLARAAMTLLVAVLCAAGLQAKIYTGFTQTAGTTGNSNEGPDKMVDGDRNTKWCVTGTPSLTDPTYIEFNSSVAFVPTGYILTTGNDTETNPGRNPKNWKLKGKVNKNDASWTEIVSVTDDNTLGATNNTPYEFTISGVTTAYQYFRFEVSALHEGGVFQLSEIELKGYEGNLYALSNVDVTMEEFFLYTGSNFHPEPVLKNAAGTTLVKNTDYTLTYSNANDAAVGSYTVTVTPQSPYTGTPLVLPYTVSYKPVGISVDKDYASDQTGYYYVNVPQSGEQSITINEHFTTPFKVYDHGGKNYTYADNANGSLVLTAPDGFVIQVTGNYKLGLNISDTGDKLTFTEKKGSEDVQLKQVTGYNSSTQDLGTVYSTTNNMTINFTSNDGGFTDGFNLTVAIYNARDLAVGSIEGLAPYQAWTGSVITPTFTVKNMDGTTLTEGTDYTVSYSPAEVKDEGIYTLTVSAKDGNTAGYTGSKSVTFRVVNTLETLDGGYTFDTEGTGDSKVYLVSDEVELEQLAAYVNSGHDASGMTFKQTANITLTKEHTPIGISSSKAFKGNYNGDDKTISGLVINQPDGEGQGLFGYTSGAKVQHVVVVDCDITARKHVGGIVGRADDNTAITYCTVSGALKTAAGVAGFDMGGIAGYSSGSLTHCVNTASITGNGTDSRCYGGIAGYNAKPISDNFNAGAVTGGTAFVGSIVGEKGSSCSLTNNYHTVSTIGGVGSNYTSTSADQAGAEVVVKITAGTGVTITYPTNPSYTWNNENLYKSGTVVTLNYALPDGKVFDHYSVDHGQISNAGTMTGEHTLTDFTQDVTITGSYADDQRDLKDGAIADIAALTFNGQTQQPLPVVTYGTETLVKDVNYTVSYSDGCTNAGTYTVTVTGTGRYSGSLTKNYTISPFGFSSNLSIVGIDAEYGQTGSAVHPTPAKVTCAATNNATLEAGTDYELSYSDGCTEPGNYTVTLTGKGNYSGTKNVTFTILSDYGITVDNGTLTWSDVPVYGNYCNNYQKNEFVLSADELAAMNGKAITQMRLYLSSKASAVWTGTFQVFMKEVDFSSFSSAQYSGLDGATIVYEGSLDATHDVMTVNFTNAYAYRGGNLLVGIYHTETGTSSSAAFYGEDVKWACIGGYNSTYSSISGSRYNFRPKTTFIYEPMIHLADDATDNSTTIDNRNGESDNVVLDGRTIYKNGDWNTICLPFDVDLTDENCPLYGATAKTLTAASVDGEHVELTFGEAVSELKAGTPYIIRWDADLFIKTTEDWNSFAAAVAGGNTYEGKVVRLTNDITVSTMVGDKDHKFMGTFDGKSHTLTLNDLSADGEFCAPFRYVDGATISNLHTAGTVIAGDDTAKDKYRTGLIGESNGTVNISNCWSSVTITSGINGDGTHGGFIGVSNGSVTFDNCLFDGTMTGSTTHSNGGFVGWNNNSLTINHSLMAGTMNVSTSNGATFSRGTSPSVNDSYYVMSHGSVQGNSVGSWSNNKLKTELGNGWQVKDDKVVPVSALSAITGPVFTGVTIDKTDRSITAANGQVQFIGYYDAFDITSANTDIYYMTAGNTLRHTGVDRTLKACRAYFKFGEPLNARTVVLNFGDEETTGVVELKNGRIEELKFDGAWYSIDGVKLDKKPTRKGLYIFNGKKIVIK